MHLVLATLTSRGSTATLDAEQVARILSASTQPGLQHVRVQAGPGRCDIGVFLIAPDRDTARRIVFEVCDRAIATVPDLRGYVVREFP